MPPRRIKVVPVADFLETFLPIDVISDLHRKQLTEGVCTSLRYICCDPTEDMSSKKPATEPNFSIMPNFCTGDMIKYIHPERGLDAALNQCYQCKHTVFYHILSSISLPDGTRYARLLRTTRTSIVSTVRFKSITGNSWIHLFTGRFANLFLLLKFVGRTVSAVQGEGESKEDVIEGAMEKAEQTLEPKWLGKQPLERLCVAGRDVVGSRIPVKSGERVHYVGFDATSKEISIVRSASWVRKEAAKAQKDKRHRHTVQDVTGPIESGPFTMMSTMLEAMKAHQKASEGYGIIHGNIAPQNVLWYRGKGGALVDWEHGRSEKIMVQEEWNSSMRNFARDFMNTHVAGS